MATIKLYNSLAKEIQEFIPLHQDEVSLYTCGPTVYNTPHIGNYRSYVFADILRRTLIAHGYNVKHVINLTDVDDKTIRKSRELGISLSELGQKYEQDFYDGRALLHLLPAFKYPKATDSIPAMLEMIQNLLDKGFAYKTDDGSIYFRISADVGYGKLVHIDRDMLKENASGRLATDTGILADEYDKDDAQDFALWKAWDEADGDVFWEPSKILSTESTIGKGRPGWHIECSGMIKEFLGDTIDIHTGGIDNMFPHHENEIAQSECANNVPFVRYFMHGGHLLVDGKKMAKSDGNFYFLNDLEERSISPLAYKYFLYGTHYRSPANMTWDGLFAAQTTLMRMYEKFITTISSLLTKPGIMQEISLGSFDEQYIQKIKDALANDLNTAEAVATLVALFDDSNPLPEIKLATVLEIDAMLGLGFTEYYKKDKTLPDDIRMLARERDNARAEKDYSKSDELRETLNTRGYIVIDTKENSLVALSPFV